MLGHLRPREVKLNFHILSKIALTDIREYPPNIKSAINKFLFMYLAIPIFVINFVHTHENSTFEN